MAVSKRLRYEVMRRDGFRCRYCGFSAAETELQVDHVQPVTLGGSDEPENLVTSCAECNAGKSSSNPDQEFVANVADDSLRWARAMKEAASIAATDRDSIDAYSFLIDEEWGRWKDGLGEPIPRPSNWRQSARQFRAAGLAVEEATVLVVVAMEGPASPSGTWRYFCGCCWKAVKDRQEVARSLIERARATE